MATDPRTCQQPEPYPGTPVDAPRRWRELRALLFGQHSAQGDDEQMRRRMRELLCVDEEGPTVEEAASGAVAERDHLLRCPCCGHVSPVVESVCEPSTLASSQERVRQLETVAEAAERFDRANAALEAKIARLNAAGLFDKCVDESGVVVAAENILRAAVARLRALTSSGEPTAAPEPKENDRG